MQWNNQRAERWAEERRRDEMKRGKMQQGSKVTFLLLLKEKQTEVYMYYQSVCMLHYEMLSKFPRSQGSRGVQLLFDSEMTFRFFGIDVVDCNENSGLLHVAEIGIDHRAEHLHRGRQAHVGVDQRRYVFAVFPDLTG